MSDQNGMAWVQDVVMVQVRFGKPGSSKKGDISLVQTEANKERLSLSKRIFDLDEYRAMSKIGTDCLKWIASRASKRLSPGMFLVSKNLVPAVVERIAEDEIKYKEAATAFVAAVPAAKERARVELKDQWREEDYPSQERLLAACFVERRLLDFKPSDAEIAGARADTAAEWMTDELQHAADDIKNGLREALKGLIDTLVEKLGNIDATGRKVLAASAVGNLLEFLELFQDRNVCNDEQLAELVKRAKSLVQGGSPEAWKASPGIRGVIVGEFGKISAALDGLIQTGPSRRISFEDD